MRVTEPSKPGAFLVDNPCYSSEFFNGPDWVIRVELGEWQASQLAARLGVEYPRIIAAAKRLASSNPDVARRRLRLTIESPRTFEALIRALRTELENELV